MNAKSSIERDRSGIDLDAFARVMDVLFWLMFLLIGMATEAVWIASKTPTLLFTGEEMLLLWSAIATSIQFFYLRVQASIKREIQLPPSGSASEIAPREARSSSFATIWQWVFLFFALALATRLSYPTFQHAQPIAVWTVSSLQMAAVVFLVMAGVLYFFSNYALVVQKAVNSSLIDSTLHLCRITYLANTTGAIVIFIYLSTHRDYSTFFGWFLIGLSLWLIAEPWLRFVTRFYLPKSQRSEPLEAGESVLIDLTFGSGRRGRNLIAQFENLIGLKMEEIWAVQFVRAGALRIVVLGVAVAWLSTCLTIVPLGSHGVQVAFGWFEGNALEPGPHVSWPWPLGEIDLVETERIREISIGFDRDLSGPMLWTKTHFTGEQNLLVGDGESLLTVDVPIQYRVSDAVAFLKTASDPTAGLKSLAARKLIEVARSSNSFQIMTVNRDQMAADLKKQLQAEIDHLGLGIEIIFVGLKDVHPPVDVAPAYEKVISAQEQKEAAIDLAEAYQAGVIPAAQASAQRLTAEAEAAKTMRVDQATGEAEKFVLLVNAEHENPDLFRERLRYDALDEGLLAPNKIIVGLSNSKIPASYLDLRSTQGSEVPVAPALQAQPELPAREHRKETPDI